MTEAVVNAAVERIADLLKQNRVFPFDISKEFVKLKAELKRMLYLLKDLEEKGEQDERVRNWVAEIRDLTYDVEDFIDTFLLQIARNSGFGFLVTKFYRFREIKKQIQLIQMKIEDISNRLQTFSGEGVGSSSETSMQQRLRTSRPLLLEENFIVDLEESERHLLAQLMKQDDRRRVVSVVGMGGIGKTTLAKKVYNHVDVKLRFDCCSWVCPGHKFSNRDVLLQILRNVVPGEERMKLERIEYMGLVEILYNALKNKRYLVVLDDIWSIEAWDSLNLAFPKETKGSKILLTTRVKDVALHADPGSSPIELQFLTDEEGWALLSKIAFRGEHISSPEFENLGNKMVKRCGGLPLALTVLGGLLAIKTSLNEWEGVYRNISAQFNLQRGVEFGGLLGVLSLSYHDLPFYLKPCLLLLSQFPPNYDIRKRELIRLWIAEGFVLQSLDRGYLTMEDIGEKYLQELISRSIIQVSQWDYTGKGVKTFRIHDLMRDVCLAKAREVDFLEVIDHLDDTSYTSSIRYLTPRKSRRIAINPTQKPTSLPEIDGCQNLRSVSYFFESDGGISLGQGTKFFKNFKLLRVLNFRSIYFHTIPKEIFNLIHLIYLGLRGRGSVSLGKLTNLCTLDIRDSKGMSLSDVLWKLERLRHLLVDRSIIRHCRLNALNHLQTLKWIEADNLIRKEAVDKLMDLRNLGIHFNTSKEVDVVLRSPIFDLGNLRSLKMSISKVQQFPNLVRLAHCHGLEKLELVGEMHSPNPEFLPASLAKLTLRHSQLKDDPMIFLQKLPNLRFLSLEQDSSLQSEMRCSTAGFPQLEILKLGSLKELQVWQVEEGSMPCLKSLHLEGLDNLRMIPEGLKFIVTIRQLTLERMPETFKKKLHVGGADFYKVQHIPSISFV